MDLTDDTLLADLDAWIADADGFHTAAALEDPPMPVALQDEAAANRMLRALGRLAVDEAKIRAVAADEVARIAAFVEDRCAGIARRRDWIERSLEGWLRGQPDDVKTVTLPNGVVQRRQPRRRVVVLDETDAALDDIEAVAPLLVRTHREVGKTLVDEFTDTGDVIDGAFAEPGYIVRQVVTESIDTTSGEVIRTVVPHVVFHVPDGRPTQYSCRPTR